MVCEIKTKTLESSFKRVLFIFIHGIFTFYFIKITFLPLKFMKRTQVSSSYKVASIFVFLSRLDHGIFNF